MNSSTRSYCSDCQGFVAGSFSQHVWTKKHQAVLAGPVIRRRSERRIRRAAAYKALHLNAEPTSLDDPAPTHKLCRGIPSLGIDSHMEPLEAFHSNRAYPDGLYVRCHSCHQFYLYSLKFRKAEAAGGAA